MIGDERPISRRRRALAHLERVRARHERRRARPWRPEEVAASQRLATGLAGAGIFAFTFGLGAAVSGPAADALARLGAGRRIESIAVLGAERLAPAEVARATGVAPGAPADEIDPREVAARLRDHPWLAGGRALRWPGGRLVVAVAEREPRAVLAVEGRDAFWVDAAGTPFARVEGDADAELPRLVPGAAVGVGRPDPLLAEGVALAERARPAELRLPAEGSDLGWVMRPRGADVDVVLGREDLDARLARWEELRASAAVELAGGARVDLRFADQAVLRKDARLGGVERKAAAARGGAPPSERGRPDSARPATGRSGGSPRRRSRRASKGG